LPSEPSDLAIRRERLGSYKSGFSELSQLCHGSVTAAVIHVLYKVIEGETVRLETRPTSGEVGMALDTRGTTTRAAEGNPAAIDALLAQVWPQVARRPLRLLVCAHASPVAEAISAFAQVMAELLDAQLSRYSPVAGMSVACDALPQELTAQGFDLLVWGEPEQPVCQQLLGGLAYHKALDRVPTSLLVVRRPRWPLHRLLLVIQGDEGDEIAAVWTARLARAARAGVTVLAVVPPLPAMYAGCVRMQQGLAELLTTDTPLGQQMRRVARRLVEWEVEGTLRLRQGVPDQEICREVAKGDADLILLSAEPHARWQRILAGRCADKMLGWADRPVLIAKTNN